MSGASSHRDLPDVAFYSRSTNLKNVVVQHLKVAGISEAFGGLPEFEVGEDGQHASARFRWTTPEGWELSAEASFNFTFDRQGRRAWEGPWGSSGTMRGDGHELSNETTDSLALVLHNALYTIQQMRRREPDWRWTLWYDVFHPEDCPDGKPVLAVGDLHGRLDLLGHLLARFRKHHFLFLGDYVDRGPDSAGVVRKVRELVTAGRATALLGNHDAWMMEVLLDGADPEAWHLNGGAQTVLSYGGDGQAMRDDAAWMRAHLLRSVVIGPVLYAHAMRPDPSGHDAQAALWGRPLAGDTPFYALPEGVTHSVHGHTPLESAPLPVGLDDGSAAWFIDTGAVWTGRLCALNTKTWQPHVIEGDTADGQRP